VVTDPMKFASHDDSAKSTKFYHKQKDYFIVESGYKENLTVFLPASWSCG